MPEGKENELLNFFLEFREFKGTIETKLDRAIADIKDLKDGTSQTIADHEKRIDKLEKGRANLRLEVGLYIALNLFVIGLMIYHIMGK